MPSPSMFNFADPPKPEAYYESMLAINHVHLWVEIVAWMDSVPFKGPVPDERMTAMYALPFLEAVDELLTDMHSLIMHRLIHGSITATELQRAEEDLTILTGGVLHVIARAGDVETKVRALEVLRHAEIILALVKALQAPKAGKPGKPGKPGGGYLEDLGVPPPIIERPDLSDLLKG